jgi:hypothetical protein
MRHDKITMRKVCAGLILLAFVCFLPTARSAGWDYSNASATAGASSGETTGLGVFSSLPFVVTATVRGGYDDNIATTHTNEQDSYFINAGAAATYTMGNPRTRVDLTLGGGVTYYFHHIPGSDDYEPNVYVGLSLTHKATPRLLLAATAYAAYQQEPDFSLGLGLNRRSGNFFYTQDKFTATYIWTPRFSTATSYTLGAVQYDSNAIGFFEDRWENTLGNEFRFLLWPTTTVVAEYRYQIISYDHINRDSMSHFALGGFDHTFNPRFNASFRGGVEFRDYDSDGSKTAPYFEGTLTYAVEKNASISWTNRYAIEEPDVLSNQSRKTFRTGLRGNYNFTPRISGILGAYYEHDAYDASTMPPASAFDEDAFDLSLTVRYAINRFFGVEAGYAHTEVTSDINVREYSRNRYWGGLNITF